MSNLELTSKNTRTASATRQGTQNKTALTKSQSVEEIRKRNQVNWLFLNEKHFILLI